MVCVDEVLRSVTNNALEVAAVPALVRGTERFHVFRSHSAVSFLREVESGRGVCSPMADCEASTVPQAALPATIRWVVEVWTSNVRILGSVSSKCFIISWILGYCSWW